MKTLGFTFLAYAVLIILMVIVNEYTRSQQNAKAYNYKGISTIHPVQQSKSKCTWACHNNTLYCKKNHTHFMLDQKNSDELYFGLLNLFRGTGDYDLANVLVLVMFGPFLSMAIFIKGILLYHKNKALK